MKHFTAEANMKAVVVLQSVSFMFIYAALLRPSPLLPCAFHTETHIHVDGFRFFFQLHEHVMKGEQEKILN